jgi:hypothetical protein
MTSRIILSSLRSFNKAPVVQTLLRAPTLKSTFLATKPFSSTSKTFQASTSNVFNELKSFLNEEIKLEKEGDKHKGALPKVAGFAVKTDGPNVTLSKNHNGEEVTVKFNVNGSLNNMEPPAEAEKPEADTEMKARPMFTVDIKKDGQVLSFSCDFLPAEEAAEGSKAGNLS